MLTQIISKRKKLLKKILFFLSFGGMEKNENRK